MEFCLCCIRLFFDHLFACRPSILLVSVVLIHYTSDLVAIMSSHEDMGMDDDEVSGIPKSPPNVDLNLQSLLLSIQANVAKNSQVLASLMAERNSALIEFEVPPSKRSRAESGFPCGDDNLPQIDIDSFSIVASNAERVASTNANCVASMNANCVATTNASCVASTNANTVPRSSLKML